MMKVGGPIYWMLLANPKNKFHNIYYVICYL